MSARDVNDDYLKDRAELASHGDPIALQQAREEEMRLSADRGVSAQDTPGNHEYVPDVGWDWEPDLVEAIAHRVWKAGDRSTPFEGWYYQPQWMEIACEILALIDIARNRVPADWMTAANTASLKASSDLQCSKVADVEYGCELRCILEAGHGGECKL